MNIISCKLKLIQECSCKSIFRIEITGMESDCWKWIVLNASCLHSGGDILLIEPINSAVQEVRSDSKPSYDNDSPDDPGGSGLVVTDVGEPMDRCGGEEFIHLPPEAPHIELWW